MDPIFAYNHSIGNCIVAAPSSAQKHAELFGTYSFCGLRHGPRAWIAIRQTNRRGDLGATNPRWTKQASMPAFSFGEDALGELYFMTARV